VYEAVIEEDLAQERDAIANSLGVLRKAVVNDNRFRRAAVDRVQEERRYLLDYAGNAMQIAGLSMLQIQDEVGRIISSGHFRNEYDRLEPELPRLLASTLEGTALVQARAPDAPFLALARVDSFQMANRKFTIVAGVKVGERFLARMARGEELQVALIYPGGMLSPGTDRSEPGVDVSRSGIHIKRRCLSIISRILQSARKFLKIDSPINPLLAPLVRNEPELYYPFRFGHDSSL